MSADPARLRRQLECDGVLQLAIRVIPKAQRTEWAGTLADGSCKVKLAAVPEKGKANEELVRFLSTELGVPRDRVEIVAGVTNPRKQVRVRR